MIPWLYLKGISTGDFPEALKAILGPDAPGLSANTVTRLKAAWEEEHEAWSKRSLEGQAVRLRLGRRRALQHPPGGGRQCILVLMGATADGKKELIAIADGYRESEQSWKELLLDCKARGLEIEPHLAIGDGALGFWKAMRQVWDTTKEQRCWVHKTANVLDKLPKGAQPKAKGMLHEIYLAESREEAEKAFDLFVKTYEAKYPKATECLSKDRDVLLTFYDFPAEHWLHIRTTNPIESEFATVRLRHNKTKGSGSRTACLTMVYKLMESASKKWRSLNGSTLLPEVVKGTVFVDGVRRNPPPEILPSTTIDNIPFMAGHRACLRQLIRHRARKKGRARAGNPLPSQAIAPARTAAASGKAATYPVAIACASPHRTTVLPARASHRPGRHLRRAGRGSRACPLRRSRRGTMARGRTGRWPPG